MTVNQLTNNRLTKLGDPEHRSIVVNVEDVYANGLFTRVSDSSLRRAVFEGSMGDKGTGVLIPSPAGPVGATGPHGLCCCSMVNYEKGGVYRSRDLTIRH